MAWAVGGTPPDMIAATVKRINSPKAPIDVTPVTMDFRNALAAIDDDTLSINLQPIVTIIRNDDASSDLLYVPPAAYSSDATRITLWVANGTTGYEYRISAVVYSTLGQTLERSFILPVSYR